ncbi:hypothetical protein DIPPA_25500 [Diplonema papillatum]|nr:hypothetical protein DIPPA_25500 [Diplonema papillatum]
MKFKLFGGLDCPDWFLPLLATLSTVPSQEAAQFASIAIDRIYGRPVDWDQVDAIAATVELDKHGMKEVLGCLHQIVTNSVRFALTASSITDELTMLGLSKETSDLVAEMVTSDASLRDRARDLNPRLHTVKTSSYKIEYVPLSSVDAPPQPVVQLSLKVAPPHYKVGDVATDTRTVNMEVSAERFQALHMELNNAYQAMTAGDGKKAR